MFFNLFINDLLILLEKHSTQSEEKEYSLLFADDFAVFYLTKNGLQ